VGGLLGFSDMITFMHQEINFVPVVFKENDVVAFCSTAQAGSLFVKDEKDILRGLENRQRLFSDLRIDLNRAVFCQQTHSDNVLIVTEKDAGRGSTDFATGVPDTDALLTNQSGITLMILVADCVPILLYDPVKKVIGAVHAGWRGTMKRILEKTVQKMFAQYGTDPKDVLAFIGPSIGPNCFAVGEDVVSGANASGQGDFVIKKDNKTFFDLWASNKAQLLENGVGDENIQVAGICSHCSSEYFSFRRDKDANRFGVGIMLR